MTDKITLSQEKPTKQIWRDGVESCLDSLPPIFTSKDVIEAKGWNYFVALPAVGIALRELERMGKVELLGRRNGGGFAWKIKGAQVDDLSLSVKTAPNGIYRSTTLDQAAPDDLISIREERQDSDDEKSVKFYFGNGRRAICTVKKKASQPPQIWWDFTSTSSFAIAESSLAIIEKGLQQMKEWQ
jgi:hypothetical protein